MINWHFGTKELTQNKTSLNKVNSKHANGETASKKIFGTISKLLRNTFRKPTKIPECVRISNYYTEFWIFGTLLVQSSMISAHLKWIGLSMNQFNAINEKRCCCCRVWPRKALDLQISCGHARHYGERNNTPEIAQVSLCSRCKSRPGDWKSRSRLDGQAQPRQLARVKCFRLQGPYVRRRPARSTTV